MFWRKHGGSFLNGAGIESAIAQANLELSLVSLRTHRNSTRLYIDSRHFPPKPGDQATKSKRYEIATGLRANLRELKVALALAKEIDSALMMKRFDWEPYLKGKQRSPETVKDWLERLEDDYWARREQTSTTLNTWRKSYQLYYNVLPLTQELTEDVLIEALKVHLPRSRSRQLCSVAYGMLAQFAGVERSQITELGKGYQPKAKTKDDILSDEQILFQIENCEQPGWRWLAAMAATFGLRNHELVKVDLARIREGIVKVKDDTKTGSRTVYACPFALVERFQLWNQVLPNIKLEGRSNNAIGSSISAGFKRMGLSRVYTFRDAYAVRLEFHYDARTPSAFKSRWMGHSAAVHEKNYLDAIQEIDHERMYERLKQPTNPDPHDRT
jgi:hypothetical protein